jgi:hypothetical protein
MPPMRYHNAMIMDLTKRWDIDMCTLHLSTGEMITLEDVHKILRVPVRGEMVHFQRDHSYAQIWENIEYCTRGPVHHEIMGLHMELVWLLYAWSLLVRWIMMFIVALVLISNDCGAHLEGGLVHIFTQMESHSTFYAWVHCILFHLYYDLGKFVYKELESMHYYTLLQVWCPENISCTIPIGYPLLAPHGFLCTFNYPLRGAWKYEDLQF